MYDRESLPRRPRRLSPVLLPLALLFVVTTLQTTARADALVLTGGTVVMDSAARVMLVNLTAQGLTINSRVDDFPFSLSGPNFNFTSASFGCGCDGFGLVTYNNTMLSAFNGGGTFNATTISGTITIFGNFDGTLNQPPYPITLSYIGTGVLDRTTDSLGRVTRVTFTVAAPVPEPGTLLLLGSGLAGLAAKVRKRRRAAPASQ